MENKLRFCPNNYHYTVHAMSINDLEDKDFWMEIEDVVLASPKKSVLCALAALLPKEQQLEIAEKLGYAGREC